MAELSPFKPDMRAQMATVRAARVAAAQWGVVGWKQLLDCGVTRSGRGRWLAQERLHKILPGVYAVGHRSVPIEGYLVAALIHAGDGAALSHETALWWWGLLEEEPATLHVSSSSRARSVAASADCPPIRVHHPRRLHAVRHRRLPVTTVAQALRDFAATAPRQGLHRAIAEADYQQLLDLDDVDEVLGRGSPGSANLRDAIAAYRPELAFTRSRLERAFLSLCEEGGLPIPEINAPRCGFKVDALWRDHRLAVELDGYGAHRSRARFEQDHDRDLRLRAAGYDPRRFTWRQVIYQRRLVIADLEAALDLHPQIRASR
jgi:predicted transcriptional regulator of viral defense system